MRTKPRFGRDAHRVARISGFGVRVPGGAHKPEMLARALACWHSCPPMAPVRGQTHGQTTHSGIHFPTAWDSASHRLTAPNIRGDFRVIPAWRLVCCLCAVMTGSHYWCARRRRRRSAVSTGWPASRSVSGVRGQAYPNTLRAVAFDRKTSSTVVAMDPVEVTSADLFEFLAEKREVSAVRRHRRLRGSTR